MSAQVGCTHLDELENDPDPSGPGCYECTLIGARWVHLRRCIHCGKVGCCDDSPNQHATAHFRADGHPIVQSYEPGEDWFWCYADQMGFQIPERAHSPSHP
jgi:uncharacterized UBP type Zn finger protein